MHRIVDTRILTLGFIVVLALLFRPIDTATASHEVTGSIPLGTTDAR